MQVGPWVLGRHRQAPVLASQLWPRAPPTSQRQPAGRGAESGTTRASSCLLGPYTSGGALLSTCGDCLPPRPQGQALPAPGSWGPSPRLPHATEGQAPGTHYDSRSNRPGRGRSSHPCRPHRSECTRGACRSTGRCPAAAGRELGEPGACPCPCPQRLEPHTHRLALSTSAHRAPGVAATAWGGQSRPEGAGLDPDPSSSLWPPEPRPSPPWPAPRSTHGHSPRGDWGSAPRSRLCSAHSLAPPRGLGTRRGLAPVWGQDQGQGAATKRQAGAFHWALAPCPSPPTQHGSLTHLRKGRLSRGQASRMTGTNCGEPGLGESPPGDRPQGSPSPVGPPLHTHSHMNMTRATCTA